MFKKKFLLYWDRNKRITKFVMLSLAILLGYLICILLQMQTNNFIPNDTIPKFLETIRYNLFSAILILLVPSRAKSFVSLGIGFVIGIVLYFILSSNFEFNYIYLPIDIVVLYTSYIITDKNYEHHFSKINKFLKKNV